MVGKNECVAWAFLEFTRSSEPLREDHQASCVSLETWISSLGWPGMDVLEAGLESPLRLEKEGGAQGAVGKMFSGHQGLGN